MWKQGRLGNTRWKNNRELQSGCSVLNTEYMCTGSEEDDKRFDKPGAVAVKGLNISKDWKVVEI